MSWKDKLPHLQEGLSIKEPVLRETINTLIDRDAEGPEAGPGIDLEDGVISAWPPPLPEEVPFVQRMRIKQVARDYLSCVTWDGTTEGDEVLFVAKPFKLRHILQNYDTITALVTVSPVVIQVSVGPVTEVWQVTLNYEYHDEILAVSGIVGGTGVPAAPDWADLNTDGRAWAQEC